jgi:hypothetical protein
MHRATLVSGTFIHLWVLMSIIGILLSGIRSDNASQFADKYAEILELLRIQQHFIHAYSHEENGLVESANREILRHIRALLLANRSQDWHIMMYVAARIMNSRVVKATGVSPQDLIFAGRLDLNRGALFPRSILESQSVSEYMRISMEAQEAMLKVAMQQQAATDLAHLDPNSEILPTIYDLNTYVLVKRETPDKLAATWRGPFLITKRTARPQGDVYTCLDQSSNKSYDFRAHLIRPYLYDENDPHPTEFSHKEHQAYVVEGVVTHRFSGKPETASRLQLLLKWVGYPEPEWQQFNADIRKLQVVHEYLSANHMSRFIPVAYK